MHLAALQSRDSQETMASRSDWIKCSGPSVLQPLCRNYHHHIVDIVDRLISGVKQKGAHQPVNIADIAQVHSIPIAILQRLQLMSSPFNELQRLTKRLAPAELA